MNNIMFKGFNINAALDNIINERDLNGNEKTILLTISFYHNGLIGEDPSISLPLDKIAE